MNKIIIIGTDPPCPRCGLLTNIIKAKVEHYGIDAEVRHLSYLDDESKLIAESIGLETGTAKDVARKLNLDIDKEKLRQKLQSNPDNSNSEYTAYNDCNWSFALDEFLRPYENKAKDVGVLMTPSLIINGKLMHQGSVPKLEKIDEWLSSL